MREIRTYGLTRGRALRGIRGVPLYSTRHSGRSALLYKDKRRRFHSGRTAGIGAAGVFAILSMSCGASLSSMFKEASFGAMMEEWTANARTNMTTETTMQFRDEVVVPFVRREMPNPFSAGGAEASKPWAKEAEHVYEVGLRNVCDGLWSLWTLDHRNCRRAGDLVKRGCGDPFIMGLSLFDENMRWWLGENKMLRGRLSEIENKLDGKPGSEFMRILSAFFRCRLGMGKWEDVHSAFGRWVRKRKFGRQEEIPLLHLSRTFCIPCDDPTMKLPDFKWMHAVASVRPVIDGVVGQTGDGTPQSIGSKGWNSLRSGGSRCGALVDEAERARPGRVETLSALFYAMCKGRAGGVGDKDRLFMAVSGKRLDETEVLSWYIPRRLLPRWGGSHSMMLRFAKACYETRRYDTALPYFYAEAQCYYVRDSATDPFRYFGKKPMVVEKCIDVCMRQATNEFACGRARLYAPFIGAAVAYYARRYEDAAKFSPYFPVFLGEWLDNLFSDKDEIRYAVDAFASDHSALCIRLQRMCDDGRWREALAEIDKLPGKVYDDFPVKHFLHTQALKARVATDFADGKDVKGIVPPYFPGWRNTGWWRCGDLTWQTHGGFTWNDHLTWRAPLPKSHELEFTFQPKPKTAGRHVLVVSRYVYEETHFRPLNGIPFVSLIWEKDRTGVVVDNDYYALLKADTSCAIWEKADGASRRIRIRVDGDGGLYVFVGDSAKPVLSTRAFCDMIRHSPETCYARFRGENVRISNIAVRKVRP